MKITIQVFSRYLISALLVSFGVLSCRAVTSKQPTVASDLHRVCSQNLYRYGAAEGAAKQSSPEQQLSFLVERMKRARCDIVAFQELPAARNDRPEVIARTLADALGAARGVSFQTYIAKSSDGYIKNGFLVRTGLGEVVSLEELANGSLPRLQRSPGPRAHFSRPPLALTIELATPKGVQRLVVVTMHFKSKANSGNDPTRTQFEVLRVEMAEALRELALQEVARHPNSVLMVVGDRNSEADSSSAAVLSGTRELVEFTSGTCRIDKSLRAECRSTAAGAPELVGLFAHRNELFPGRYRQGSYRYRKREQLIDEILIRPADIPLVSRSGGALAIGMEGEFLKGSDHRLLWAELDWSRAQARPGAHSR